APCARTGLSGGMQVQPDAPHGRVFGIRVVGEAQAGHQREHGTVVGQHQAVDVFQPLFARGVDQRFHQLPAQLAALPVVADDQGIFGAAPVGVAQVVGETDDDFARVAAVLGVGNLRGGHQGELAVVVDLGV